MLLAFHVFPTAEVLQGSVMSIVRGLCFLRLKGHLLLPDARDVTIAASRKPALSDLCPAFCHFSGVSRGGEATLLSFGSLAGVIVCAWILVCVCMG